MSDRFKRSEAGPAVLDVDRLLHEFYEAEMPDPWPKLALPAAVPFRRPAARYSRTFRRLAIAASLVLALLGYWALAGLFPRDGAAGTAPNGLEIGHKPGHKAPVNQLAPIERIRTPDGNEAQQFNEDLPDGKAMIIIGTPSTKGPRP